MQKDISIEVEPRNFIEHMDLPLLPRLRLYDPSQKPRGLQRLKRKFGQIADDVVHGYMHVQAHGAFVVRKPDGSLGTMPFDAHQSAYLAFISRALHGGYEPRETMFLEAMLPKAFRFYDIGANWGFLFPAGRDACGIFRRNLRLRDIRPNECRHTGHGQNP